MGPVTHFSILTILLQEEYFQLRDLNGKWREFILFMQEKSRKPCTIQTALKL